MKYLSNFLPSCCKHVIKSQLQFAWVCDKRNKRRQWRKPSLSRFQFFSSTKEVDNQTNKNWQKLATSKLWSQQNFKKDHSLADMRVSHSINSSKNHTQDIWILIIMKHNHNSLKNLVRSSIIINHEECIDNFLPSLFFMASVVFYGKGILQFYCKLSISQNWQFQMDSRFQSRRLGLEMYHPGHRLVGF